MRQEGLAASAGTDDDRAEFLRLGLLEHAPEQVRQEVERTRSELATALQDKAELEAKLIGVRAQALELAAENARLAAKLKQVGHD